MNEAALRRYAAQSVPRYTSYPTAAEFAAAVGPDDKARWLERLDATVPVSLYLHVPYCREICHYCGCTTKMVRRDHVLTDYRRLVEAEIALTGEHLARSPRVAQLHWGGGTPALLGADGLSALIAALAEHLTFETGFEHAIELDPRGVTPDLARVLIGLGINRVSLGVQDLDPAVQAAIGRVQPLAVVAAAFAALRDAGLTRINVDLIYGLPKQSCASVAETARHVIELGPDRVACYGYAHLPKRKRNQRLIDAAELAGPDERLAQAETIAWVFTDAGYEAIGIDHFARSDDSLAIAARAGRLSRNFQGYTDEARTLLGFGASAISCFPEGYAQSNPNVEAYAFALGQRRLPVLRGWALSEADRVRGAIIRELMCRFRVDLADHAAPDAFADEMALLRPMIADGLVTQSGTTLAMTAQGRPLVRVVAAVFDAFRTNVPQEFSIAV